MQLNPLQIVRQFAHVLQQELFPELESSVGPLSGELKLLAAVVSMAPLELMLSARRASTGRPSRDRAALNLPATRDLISRLRVDAALRRFRGWFSPGVVPHQSKFSRAFAEFAATGLPRQWPAAVIEATQRERLIGHIARDSAAIPARETVPETLRR